MFVIWLRMVHSDVRRKMRSAGVEVFIWAERIWTVLFGAAIAVLDAATVALSAGRLDAASAPKPRVISMNAVTVRTASSATTDMRRAVTTPVIGESPPGISY